MKTLSSAVAIVLATASLSPAQDQANAQAQIQFGLQCYSVNKGLAQQVLQPVYRQAGFDPLREAEYEAAAAFWLEWLGEAANATPEQVGEAASANIASVGQSLPMISQAAPDQQAAMRRPFETALSNCADRRAEIEPWMNNRMACYGREGLGEYQTGLSRVLAESSARVWLYVERGQVVESIAELRIAIGDDAITGSHGVSVMRYNNMSDQVLGAQSSYPAHVDLRWEGRSQRPFDAAPMRVSLVMPQPEIEGDNFYFGDMALAGDGGSLWTDTEIAWGFSHYDGDNRTRPFAHFEADEARQALTLLETTSALSMWWRDVGQTLLEAEVSDFDFSRYTPLLEAAHAKALNPSNCSPDEG
ncbi:MAG: hypothetical protein AAFX09_08440 [Pseudomonadota bacterium]